ncbi:hypothetical protein OJAV_G00095470 [Oryzias javanicus]|uniref:Uncharacterized protein n=1 Tax=Oryzias javanicus TaxID=123683 RepID=A0A3S2MXF5_ORYJA|nr:hypothetical protein OJAV_G00095470 [Oryzias javanicus]
MVRYLLESGADPNIQDKTGKTALMHACLEQTGGEIVSLLLNNGADPTLEDHAGVSALVYAVNSGNRDILDVILNACKAKGKEVIIITTNKMPSGQQKTKQYLNVPPPPELEGRLVHTSAPCCLTPNDVHLPSSSQGHLVASAPQPGSPVLGLRDPQCLDLGLCKFLSRPGSPTMQPSPFCVPGADKRSNLLRLHSELGCKSPSLLLQSQSTSLMEEPLEMTPQEEISFKVNDLITQRRLAVSRHHSIDVKDAAGLQKALETMIANESKVGGGRRGLGRKMSYDSAAGSLHSASHPNLHQDSLPFAHESSPVDEGSSDCLRQLTVSSLQNVVHRRNIGIDHYSSDSQLLQVGNRDRLGKSSAGSGSGPERHKLINSRPSTLSGSRESLESSVQQRRVAGLERRGSGALLLDHIAHTRPGYLPPLNPHVPIPNIGVSSSSTYPVSGSKKTLSAVLSKPVVPCAPGFPPDLKAKKMLWRRHSMQSEQIKQLANFEETFGR